MRHAGTVASCIIDAQSQIKHYHITKEYEYFVARGRVVCWLKYSPHS